MQGLFTAYLHNRRAVFISALLAYIALFVVTGRVSGHGMAVWGILPVVAAAFCWGWKAGLAAGLAAFPVNVLIMIFLGIDWKHSMLSGGGIIGHIAFIIEGLIIGWVRDLYLQRQEANELLQQEIARRACDMDLLRATEQRLATIIHESVDAILITGKLMSTIDIANRAFLELLGRPAEEVIGRRLFDFMPVAGNRYETSLGEELVVDEQMYSDMLAKMTELAERGRVSNWEFFLLNSRGQAVPLETNVTYFYAGKQEREGAVAIFRDITQRKLFERELQEAKDFLENIIENSLDGIIISDATGHITSVNRACSDMMGYDAEALLGLTPASFAFFDEGWYETTQGEQLWLGMSDMMASYSRMDEFFKTGKIANYIFYIKRKDGRLAEVEANIAMLYSQTGDALGSVSIMRDITARRSMEHKLVRQRDQLAVANSELESFSYSVSHDLRAPLRSISGFASALTEDFGHVLPAEGRRYLERIRTATGRMGSLIDDMLKLSRVTRYEMRREQVNLSALAADIAAQLREQERGRDVSCTIEPGLITMGDGHLLRIALENILGNAWKYTGTRPRAEIFFGIAHDGDGATQEHVRGVVGYCVRDNGVGFDMAYADKLFGAFQRLHAEREFPGTGIGLATVQRIVHRHGGRIWARSTPDDGATFCFTLTQEG